MINYLKKLSLILFGTGVMLFVALLTSCSSTQSVAVNTDLSEKSAYENFVIGCKDYPTVMKVYLDDALLARATPRNQIVISLSQQRGRLYVDNQVAADWPVSTGADTHPTPVGNFRVRLKKKEHASNRYGKIYDAENKCIDNNADVFTNPVPEGCRFEGSSMPNWMRLTSDGVGMHTGKVRAGKRLSHGCIRLPHSVACMLFDIVDYGSRVAIIEDIEPGYPVAEIMAQREIIAAESAAEAEPEELSGETPDES